MRIQHRTALAIACAVFCSAPLAQAADNASITLYRSDSPGLYASNGDNTVNDGYAVVREQRSVNLQAGVHDLVLGDLPNNLDAEAMALYAGEGVGLVHAEQPAAAIVSELAVGLNILPDIAGVRRSSAHSA